MSFPAPALHHGVGDLPASRPSAQQSGGAPLAAHPVSASGPATTPLTGPGAGGGTGSAAALVPRSVPPQRPTLPGVSTGRGASTPYRGAHKWRLYDAAGLDLRTVQAYRQHGLLIAPQTMPGRYRQLVTGAPLIGGKIGDVRLARMPDSKSWDLVFKRPIFRAAQSAAAPASLSSATTGLSAVALPDSKALASAAHLPDLAPLKRHIEHRGAVALGISKSQPRDYERALAAHAVSRLLGFQVIPETTIGLDEHGNPGLVMPYLNGMDEARLSAAQLREPLLRKRLVELQWFDALVGNVDRNYRNVHIETRGSGAAGVQVKAVWGIDNDNCFAPVNDPQMLAASKVYDPTKKGFVHGLARGTHLPEVVDRAQFEAFKRLDVPALVEAITFLLPDADVQACTKRLEKIMIHLHGLAARGRVIDPDEWGLARIGRYLRGRSASYVGRQEHELEPRRRRGSLDGLTWQGIDKPRGPAKRARLAQRVPVGPGVMPKTAGPAGAPAHAGAAVPLAAPSTTRVVGRWPMIGATTLASSVAATLPPPQGAAQSAPLGQGHEAPQTVPLAAPSALPPVRQKKQRPPPPRDPYPGTPAWGPATGAASNGPPPAGLAFKGPPPTGAVPRVAPHDGVLATGGAAPTRSLWVLMRDALSASITITRAVPDAARPMSSDTKRTAAAGLSHAAEQTADEPRAMAQASPGEGSGLAIVLGPDGPIVLNLPGAAGQ